MEMFDIALLKISRYYLKFYESSLNLIFAINMQQNLIVEFIFSLPWHKSVKDLLYPPYKATSVEDVDTWELTLVYFPI